MKTSGKKDKGEAWIISYSYERLGKITGMRRVTIVRLAPMDVFLGIDRVGERAG